MNAQLMGASATDARTGTRRLDLWRENCGTSGAYGDMARGDAYTARYLSDHADAGLCAEIAVFPVEYEDGTYGVEECATIGRAMLEDGVWRPDDSADTTYESPDVRVFSTLESAQLAAADFGQRDYSFALYLRGR
jgi:hypothetical protein